MKQPKGRKSLDDDADIVEPVVEDEDSEARRRAARERRLAARAAAERRAGARDVDPVDDDEDTDEDAEDATDDRRRKVTPISRAKSVKPRSSPPALAGPKTPARRADLPSRQVATPRPSVRVVQRQGSWDRLMRASRRRVSGAFVGFIMFVVLPTIGAGAYYNFYASPQYVSEFRFSVRFHDGVGFSGLNAQAMSNPLSLFSDNFIVANYVLSRDVVDSLDKTLNLKALYAREDADWWSRFPANGTIEDLVDYWSNRATAHFDMATGINVVEIRAFSPEDAQKIAMEVKRLCEMLVNQISTQARENQLRYAEDVLKRAEERVTASREAATEYRKVAQIADGQAAAESRTRLAEKLQQDLSAAETEYNTVRTYLDEDSPRIRVIKNRIEGIKSQLDAIGGGFAESDSTKPDVGGTAEVLARFEAIKADQDVALELWKSALESYEQARTEAQTRQLYLATFVQPSLPQDAAYPRRVLDTFLFFLAACGAWIVSTLLFYSIRDHA